MRKEDKITPNMEITPRMTEAGFEILAKSGIADGLEEADKIVVGKIFRAMVRAALQDREL
jgi:hypothetical protein